MQQYFPQDMVLLEVNGHWQTGRVARVLTADRYEIALDGYERTQYPIVHSSQLRVPIIEPYEGILELEFEEAIETIEAANRPLEPSVPDEQKLLTEVVFFLSGVRRLAHLRVSLPHSYTQKEHTHGWKLALQASDALMFLVSSDQELNEKSRDYAMLFTWFFTWKSLFLAHIPKQFHALIFFQTG